MTYTIGDNPTQVYYDPANPDWQKYIAGVMKSAMDRMGSMVGKVIQLVTTV